MFLKLFRTLLFSLLLAIAASAVAEALPMPTYMVNSEAGFRINYPPAWSTGIYPEENAIDIADGNAFVYVDAIPLEFVPVTDLEELVELFLQDLIDEFDELEVDVLVGETLAERDAIRIEYRGVLGAETLLGALIFTLDEAYLYMVDYYTSAELFAEYEATLLAMVASFRFLDD
jgi:hypothetical protein